MPVFTPTKNFLSATSRLLFLLFLTIGSYLSAQIGKEVKHWAYDPPGDLSPPNVSDKAWADNPIDAFIYANLKKQKLEPNPPADKLVLLRRAYYDLTGLPPTEEQANTFLLDDSPRAWENLINQLLDSPHYGEKWGRHWLDVARWAESNGYERDGNKRNMWKYRDYVINAVNQDKPYDEFIIDQLAGDVKPGADAKSVTATGFLHLGLYDDEPADEEQFYYDYYDDLINTVSRSMLASSMSCARCHDHKVDPITQKDYYQFLSHFKALNIPFRIRNQDISTVSIFDPEKETELNAKLEKGIADIILPRLKVWQAANHLRKQSSTADLYPTNLHFGYIMDDWNTAHGDLDSIDYFYEGALPGGTVHITPDLTQITPAKTVPSSYVITGKFNQAEAGPRTFKVTINGGAWMYLGDELVFSKVGLNTITEDFTIDLPAGTHDLKLIFGRHTDIQFTLDLLTDGKPIKWVTGTRWRQIKGAANDAIKDSTDNGGDWGSIFKDNLALENKAVEAFKPLQETMEASLVTAAFNMPEVKPTYIMYRGNPHAPGEEVLPGLPTVMGNQLPDSVSKDADRRLQLAHWIASAENPLTSRVAVNRIWQHHFGRGLVRSSEEFGGLGSKPTHPELLDWLANEFVRNGWTMKPLHRLIMTSNTYQMSSAPNDEALTKDPLNDHFWRFDMRRLTAEEIRDSILMVSNHLNSQVGGPSVFPTLPEEVLATASRAYQRWDLEAGEEHQNRRSIYTFTRRSLLDPMMSTFDSADTDTSCPVRFNTTVPSQALTMMNSQFIADHAERIAKTLKPLADQGLDSVVNEGFTQVLGRLPNDEERKVSIELIQSMQSDFDHDLATAINRFALMMLNLNEFVFLD